MKGVILILLAILLDQIRLACTDQSSDLMRKEVLLGLDWSLKWLDALPLDTDRPSIGKRTLDAWPRTFFSRLYPDSEIGARCAEEVRAGLQAIEPRVEPTLLSFEIIELLKISDLTSTYKIIDFE